MNLPFFQNRGGLRVASVGAGTIRMVFTLTLILAFDAHAARIIVLNGKLTIQRGDKTLAAAVGARLRPGDAFTSEANSEALVRFDDGARLALRPESRLEITALKLKGPPTDRQKTLKFVKGGLRYISGRTTAKNNVSFITNTATIGIRGTDIEIAISEDAINTDPAGTYLKVNTGMATLAAADGTQVEVDPGQIAFGGEPELVPRSPGGVRRPAARKVVESVTGVFKPGRLDRLMR
jgi:FecR protein